MTAAAAAVLVLAAGCRDTQWPSNADQEAFCDTVASAQLTEGGVDQDLRQLGTPANLPFEARRYLLDLADGHDPVPAEKQVFDTYLADHC
ncbi:hypothetical protein [Nocardioides sp. Root79]|uniref:hypothetical protein n=2 Tax=unclassified Nocardioides TaxID=2615069 RepID=UPI0012F9A65A|nr:hypothetical protein [Nocardioides sp. Root79]